MLSIYFAIFSFKFSYRVSVNKEKTKSKRVIVEIHEVLFALHIGRP